MTKTKQSTKQFNDSELRKALFAFQDVCERLTCPFFPLHDTAIRVKAESELKGDGIYVGILVREWTDQRERMFKTLNEMMGLKAEKTKKGYDLELEGVPVHLTIIKKNYKFFKNPEIRFFGVTEFLLPNPLDGYLKAQYLIQ